ncbi:MAG: endonuclease/exonuclease/phosphatase family protein [Dysgonamonadaceae bacterium]|nr:endonuclease/exonuclease/phosphatase family protein [Dysgonamonadaceae bacterium]
MIRTSKSVIYFLSFALFFVLQSCKGDYLTDYLPAPDNLFSDEDLQGDLDTLRLVTYNVKVFSYNASYPDGNYRVIADVLKDLRPDAVCLQELDSVNTRNNVYQLQRMADLNAWNYRFAATLNAYRGGKYGIGIATPHTMLNHASFPVTSVDEQRGCLVVELDKFVMVCVHLGGTEDVRKLQAQEITAKVKELYGASSKPVFMGGDFNSTPTSATMTELYRSWKLLSGQENTVSNGNSCIDYLLMLNKGGLYKVVESRVVKTSPFGNMPLESDHLPVMVEVVVPKGRGGSPNDPDDGGDGTPDSPYLIRRATQLDSIRYHLSTAQKTYYKLMTDLDLKDLGETNNWRPLNADGAYMDFDGNGHVIKNMHIATEDATTPNYQSFAGLLWGTVKNLGLVNVHVDCPKIGNAAGIAGYAGAATPAAAAYRTGIVENCFVTGYVSSGGGTVGGIVGVVGRAANNGTPSYVRNCYFSGEVHNKYTGTAVTVRTGGIAGLVYSNTTQSANTEIPIQNCYATGYFHAQKGRVGGIAGETELPIQNCVAYADLEIVSAGTTDGIGLVAGYCIATTGKWGGANNCWAYTGARMKYVGSVMQPGNFENPSASTAPVDGTPKDAAFLSVAANYAQLYIDSDIWSPQLRGMYLQLAWVAARTDAVDIDGLTTIPAIP